MCRAAFAPVTNTSRVPQIDRQGPDAVADHQLAAVSRNVFVDRNRCMSGCLPVLARRRSTCSTASSSECRNPQAGGGDACAWSRTLTALGDMARRQECPPCNRRRKSILQTRIVYICVTGLYISPCNGMTSPTDDGQGNSPRARPLLSPPCAGIARFSFARLRRMNFRRRLLA